MLRQLLLQAAIGCSAAPEIPSARFDSIKRALSKRDNLFKGASSARPPTPPARYFPKGMTYDGRVKERIVCREEGPLTASCCDFRVSSKCRAVRKR